MSVIAAVVFTALGVGLILVGTGVIDLGDNEPSSASGETGAPGSRSTAELTIEPTSEPATTPQAPPPHTTPAVDRSAAGIDDARTDRKPVTADAIFPEAKVVDSRRYRRVGTGSTPCTESVSPALPERMNTYHCSTLLRATYLRRDVALTAGVAVFPHVVDAKAAVHELPGPLPWVDPLPARGARGFRPGAETVSSHRVVGRYVVFTAAGYADGRAFTDDDRAVLQARGDVDEIVRVRIRSRG